MEAVKKKMATLKQKEKEAVDKAVKAEEELNSVNEKATMSAETVADLNGELQRLEEELDEKESQLSYTLEKLLQAEHSADESLRAKTVLETRTVTDEEKLAKLDDELSRIAERNDDIEKEYERIAGEIEMLEEELQIAEERATNGEEQVRALEVDFTQVGNNLRSLELNESQATDREGSYQQRLDALNEEYTKALERAEVNEARAKEMEDELSQTEEALEMEKALYNKVKLEYEQTLAELAEL